MYKFRVKLNGYSHDVTTTLRNLSHLVEGASLLIAAYYNYYTAYHAHSLSQFELSLRVAASVVIGLRGAYELGRWLANKEVR